MYIQVKEHSESTDFIPQRDDCKTIKYTNNYTTQPGLITKAPHIMEVATHSELTAAESPPKNGQ